VSPIKLTVLDSVIEFPVTKENPGPGRYNPPPAITPKGNYFLSKYRNSCTTIISPSSNVRFKTYRSKFFDLNVIESLSPGPTDYSPQREIGEEVPNFASKFRHP
jgi:hypothetical protein